jgi:hypothetical protein
MKIYYTLLGQRREGEYIETFAGKVRIRDLESDKIIVVHLKHVEMTKPANYIEL